MKILLCSDLDRTLIPNGPQPESPEARRRLHDLATHPEVTLAYVSGRDRGRLAAAVEEWQLPVPDYAIGDVGTTIHRTTPEGWTTWQAWSEAIAPDWNGRQGTDLLPLFEDIGELTPQEPDRQNRHKLSFYAAGSLDPAPLLARLHRRLEAEGLQCNLIWSVDETRDVGLLDVLPASASKLHAILFLMREAGFLAERTVFAGDSGNDLEVLTSPVNAVLVRNATDEVRRAAVDGAARHGNGSNLYLARGGFLGMNGNYSAGVLEGVAHFIPDSASLMG